MIQVDNDQTAEFIPQKNILQELENTLIALQRPRQSQPPQLSQNDFSQQSALLKEIEFFCQKLTTVKKQKPKFEEISTKQFTCSTPDIVNQIQIDSIEEPQKLKTEPQQLIPTQTKKTGIVKQYYQTPKLVIKQLQFETEKQHSWIPIKIEKKLQNSLPLNLNTIIFWPEEELAQLKYQPLNLMSDIQMIQQSTKSSILKKLKIYGIVVCMDQIHLLRELYIRISEIKQELQSEVIYERKRSMLSLEQKRITKKIFLRYLHVRILYKNALMRIFEQITQVNGENIVQNCFQVLKQYKIDNQQKKKEKEFYLLVQDHLRVKKLNQLFVYWKLFINCQKNFKKSVQNLKYLFLKQYFKKWNLLKFEQEHRIKQISQEPEENEDNKILSQFLTEEKSPQINQNYGFNNLGDVQILFEKECQVRKTKLIIFELQEEFKQCPNLMEKAFIKWKIAFLQQHRGKQFYEILEMRKIKKIFQILKQNRKIHPFRSFMLMRKGLEGFKYNILYLKQQRLQEQLKQITLRQQRQEIETMAIEVYKQNIIKRVFKGWKNQIKNEEIQELWLSLSDKKQKQDKQIQELKFEIIQKKRKIKYFQRWVTNFVKSKQSIKNLKYCEVSAKEKAIENLIRIAFETSMKTQFKWLEYYQEY